MNNTGGPAFPAPAGVAHITDQGMTLRDYFAARAMEGDISRIGYYQRGQDMERAAANAYAMADAMLKARETK